MTPIIIIGAPRSGTNILRDTITSFDNISSWDCDEIPYVWTYGNEKYPTDLFTLEHYTPKINDYIREQFIKVSNKNNSRYVVEKTCANSLRVSFINEIFPDAKYIFIVRDGYDASYSILQRWKGSFSLEYSLKKLKYVPLTSIPFYGIKFLNNRLYKLKNNNNHLKFWGPRFTHQDNILNEPLEKVASRQWAKCVEMAKQAFNRIDDNRVYSLTYEELVSNPAVCINEICEFIGFEYDTNIDLPKIHKESIGRGLKMFSSKQLDNVKPIISPINGNKNEI